MKKITSFILGLGFFVFAGCSGLQNKKLSDDIVVLFTNDVHCAVEKNIGYSGLVSLKEKCLSETPFVTLVDDGDAVQGGLIGSVTRGNAIIDIMNEADYDFAILGNHEFDYGMQDLDALMKKAEFTYLASNIRFSGKGTNILKNTVPFKIVKYDDVKVAYIGVSTPNSITSSSPVYFMEDGKLVYDFGTQNDGNAFYKRIQKTVNKAKRHGADFVIAVTHLGVDLENGVEKYSAIDMIKNTDGIDAVLDGHSHTVVNGEQVENKSGKKVLLSQTGTQFENVGKLVISKDKKISVELISEVNEHDKNIERLVKNITEETDQMLSEIVFVSDAEFDVVDSRNIRLVRNQEIPLGNIVSDSIRYCAGAEIALINGGAIRNKMPEGNVSLKDMINILPFGNKLAAVEVKGSAILDALEFSMQKVQVRTDDGEKALCENGGFFQVSGIKFEVDTSIPTPVVVNANGFFEKIEGERRVKNVFVLTGDVYTPIDENAVYCVAGTDYIMESCGDGFTMFNGCKPLINNAMFLYDAVIEYTKNELNGKIKEKYSVPKSRIIVK